MSIYAANQYESTLTTFFLVPFDGIIQEGVMGSASKNFPPQLIPLTSTVWAKEYQRMADALATVSTKTGTTFIFSLCEWGWVRIIFYFDWFYI